MGKVKKELNIFEELKEDNFRIRDVDLQIFADALQIYCDAAHNIKKNGAVCFHPRTGAPIENPFIKIQVQQIAVLKSMKDIKSDRVLKMLKEEIELRKE